MGTKRTPHAGQQALGLEGTRAFGHLGSRAGAEGAHEGNEGSLVAGDLRHATAIRSGQEAACVKSGCGREGFLAEPVCREWEGGGVAGRMMIILERVRCDVLYRSADSAPIGPSAVK